MPVLKKVMQVSAFIASFSLLQGGFMPPKEAKEGPDSKET